MSDEEQEILDDLENRGLYENERKAPEYSWVRDPRFALIHPMHELLEATFPLKMDVAIEKRKALMEALENCDTPSELLDTEIEMIGLLEQVIIAGGWDKLPDNRTKE